MNTHDVSTVIHVLLQILFLEERDTCWAYPRHPKCIYVRAAFRHWPGTQTRASGTCRCGWCHEEWRYLRASGLSAETLQDRGERCQSGADAERGNQTALGTVEDSQMSCQQDEVRTRWAVLYLLWWLCRARPPRAPAGSLSERPSCRLICFGLWKQWRKSPAEASH